MMVSTPSARPVEAPVCIERPARASEQGPTLLGDEFLEGWDGEVLAELMILMMDTMPGDNPGGLTEEEFTDVLSYLLRENGYPPGDELTADMLEEIVIDLHLE